MGIVTMSLKHLILTSHEKGFLLSLNKFFTSKSNAFTFFLNMSCHKNMSKTSAILSALNCILSAESHIHAVIGRGRRKRERERTF